MTVEDLIHLLSDQYPHAEVKIAYQPNYPMGMNTGDELAVSEDGMEVYIAQTGYGGNFYLPEDICEQLDW